MSDPPSALMRSQRRAAAAAAGGGIAVLVVVKMLVHLLSTWHDGYFRDELYYIACSQHPALGYVDHPPLSIAILWLVRHTFGESLLAMRLTAALAGAATMLVAAHMAAALGGGRWARLLAALAVLTSPIYLGVNSFFSMNSFEILLWALAADVLLHILVAEPASGGIPPLEKGGQGGFAALAPPPPPLKSSLIPLFERGRPEPLAVHLRFLPTPGGLLSQDLWPRWALLGLVLGLGLENKLSMSWFGGAMVGGLLLSTHRRVLLTAGPWIAAGIAALLFAPHLWWQAANGWPTLEFMRHAAAEKMVGISPFAFLGNQILVMGPLSLPLWLAGLVYLLWAPQARPARPLGWIYVFVLLLLVVNQTSRANYLAPAYVMLLAAGGVATERLGWRWLAPVYASVLMAAGVALAPLALPLLSPEHYVRYAHALGIEAPAEERDARGQLPQHLADRYGWEEIVATVAHVYRSLPPDERAVAGIFTGNYGEAAAIDVLGGRYGLPAALSGHNNYWLWGPRGTSGEVMIVLGVPRAALEARFEEVQEAAVIDCGWCRPLENHRPVYVCRKPKQPLASLWDGLKWYI